MLHGNCLNLDEQAPALLADFRFATDITKVPTSSDTVGFQKGFSNEDSYTDVSANGQGVFSLSIDELERVVIHLNSSLSVSEGSVKSSPDDSSFYYTGYLVVGNELRELPTGSAIHGSDGIFYWQPGPGFYGEYQLVFIGTSSNDGLSSVHKKSFTINIR
ncbi:MAG: hypothetical protein GY757_54630, partial [bacterium]|nr:hypothetical protein [bacterium]